jgi:DNA-binding NtrC family response regulator
MSSASNTVNAGTALARWLDFRIEVRSGPDAGRRFEVRRSDPFRQLLGTSEACELRLGDPTISRRHAAIELVPGALHVVDLGSTNGTRIDAVSVVDALWSPGQRLNVGGTVLEAIALGVSRELPPQRLSFGRVLGASEPMQRLYAWCDRIAASELSVVLEGETGTGKDLLAEALHEASPRAKGPFLVFDCGAVQPGLMESELFGHERGSFSGATAARPGLFELAHGGTLLLDEPAELDLDVQPKLLRALEGGEVRRIGAAAPRTVDVRLITASRKNLDLEVQAGRLREDLFHRIAVSRLELPPLRERRGDIELLARHFWSELGGKGPHFPVAALERWRVALWPGNVRELKNAVARVKALGTSEPVEQGPKSLEAYVDPALPFIAARDGVLDAFTRRYVEQLLEAHGGDVAKAAAASGIGRRYFQKLKLKAAKGP